MSPFQFLKNKGILYKENFDTSAFSHIRAGGIASLIAYPRDAEELIYLITESKSREIRYKVIGGCSNTYFSDNGFLGMIISTSLINSFNASGDVITLGAGCYLSSAIKKAIDLGISFAPSLFGIPGTVGGALRNNAGALGSEISDYFVRGTFFSVREGKLMTLSKNDLWFSYRSSAIGNESTVFIKGEFLSGCDSREKSLRKMSEAIDYRRKKHPSLPSLGSFFKRNGGVIPAALIDKAGLRGKRIGNAAVSDIHSGFIVNLGGATAREVDALASEVAYEVYEKFGVILVREAELVE